MQKVWSIRVHCDAVGVLFSGVLHTFGTHYSTQHLASLVTMFTLVFNQQEQALSEVQVGASDIVSTLSAAHKAWGWIGGLTGVKRFLEGISTYKAGKDPFQALRRCTTQIDPVKCQIFTSHGMFPCEDSASPAFEGDPLLQTVGLTICALAHECGGLIAVDLFVKLIAQETIKTADLPGLEESLYQQLVDSLPIILNEGSARGLNDRFIKAADALDEPAHRFQTLPSYSKTTQHVELSLLGGFLVWVQENQSGTYYTRSALAVRNAAYLKAIGYKIGHIICWSGDGEPPQPPRGVVLVLGGTGHTDELLSRYIRVPETIRLHFYYRTETIGSLFVNAVGIKTPLAVETIQDMYSKVHRIILKSIQCTWDIPKTTSRRRAGASIADRDGMTTYAVFTHNNSRKRPTSVAMRLAALHFATCAEMFAHCYEPYGTDKMLSCVTESMQDDLDLTKDNEQLEYLALFRILTACIVFSVLSLLDNGDFSKIVHMTQLDLNTHVWLERVATTLDKSMKHGVSFYDAMILLSMVHAGAPYETLEIETAQRCTNLGYRQGAFAVMPSLFKTMRPHGDDVLGLTCFGAFLANVPVFPDGTVRAGGEDPATQASAPAPPETTRMNTDWQKLSELNEGAANVTLYVGLERPLLSTSPTVVFSARMRGTVVGTASVRRVLYVITRSWNQFKMCSGHPGASPVRAIQFTTSDWSTLGQERLERVSSEMQKANPLHIPMQSSSSWVFCVAGCAAEAQVAISFGCAWCAMDLLNFPAHSPAIICGYGPLEHNPNPSVSHTRGFITE